MANYQYISETNITNLSGIFVYIQSNVPIFMPVVLLMIGTILTFASYFSQRRMTGTANFWGSATVGSWITTLCAFILSMVHNDGYYLVNITTVLICLAITIVLSIFFFFKNDDF
jgi:hypothetical protein